MKKNVLLLFLILCVSFVNAQSVNNKLEAKLDKLFEVKTN